MIHTTGDGAASPDARLRRRWIVAAGLVVATILIGVAWWPDRTTYLVVVDASDQTVLYQRVVESGDEVALEHQHSVTGRTVRERFVILDSASLGMVSLEFDRHGANLPTGPERIGSVTTTYREMEDGSYRVLHHERPLPTVPMIVGSHDVDHTLVFGDDDHVRLLSVARPWQQVELKVIGARSR